MEVRNNSGWRPQGHSVLLLTFELVEKQTVIVIPEEVAMSSATQDSQGIVVEIGPDCWTGPNETPRAKVGDRVLITKYAGGMIKGNDGRIYRMIPSHSIYATKENSHG